ncbi:hypothetical protein GJV44_00201 [Candidatus Vallotia cooleyia]|nr:hypothetical protein GJV44_00201 [Candidatus Vallotia cooleyia]
MYFWLNVIEVCPVFNRVLIENFIARTHQVLLDINLNFEFQCYQR